MSRVGRVLSRTTGMPLRRLSPEMTEEERAENVRQSPSWAWPRYPGPVKIDGDEDR